MRGERLLDEVLIIGKDRTDAVIVCVRGESIGLRIDEQDIGRRLAEDTIQRFVALQAQIRAERAAIVTGFLIIWLRSGQFNQITPGAVLRREREHAGNLFVRFVLIESEVRARRCASHHRADEEQHKYRRDIRAHDLACIEPRAAGAAWRGLTPVH